MQLNRFPQILIKWALRATVFLWALFMVRIFVADVYYVPSSSMKNAILPGEFIMATKWKLKGKPAVNIKRFDVIVFKHPVKESVNLVKRCVGLPGDTLEIKKDNIYINGNIVNERVAVTHKYKTHLTLGHLQKSIAISENDSDRVIVLADTSIFALTQFEVNTLSDEYGADALILAKPADYGPVIIPYEGMPNDNTYIDEESAYTQDYYFFLGDNRPFSKDSRIWGAVPHERIIGKARRIIYSKNDSNEVRWSRFLAAVK